jgi:siroheme synthase
MNLIKEKVYLIGAGPGKNDFITVKGNEILKNADVIIYDSLINPLILYEIQQYPCNGHKKKYIKVKKKEIISQYRK